MDQFKQRQAEFTAYWDAERVEVIRLLPDVPSSLSQMGSTRSRTATLNALDALRNALGRRAESPEIKTLLDFVFVACSTPQRALQIEVEEKDYRRLLHDIFMTQEQPRNDDKEQSDADSNEESVQKTEDA